VLAAKVECLPIEFGVQGGGGINGHAADRIGCFGFGRVHLHVLLRSIVIVISIFVLRGLEVFQCGVSSRVVVMARHCPQRGMNIGTRPR
jgi:hypothetical protein